MTTVLELRHARIRLDLERDQAMRVVTRPLSHSRAEVLRAQAELARHGLMEPTVTHWWQWSLRGLKVLRAYRGEVADA